MDRIPAQAFPLAELLGDEMASREWTTDDVARRIGGDADTVARNMLYVMLLLSVQRIGLVVGDKMFDDLARVFDVDPQFFRNIDNAWRNAPEDRRQFYEPPEALFGPVSRRGFIRAV